MLISGGVRCAIDVSDGLVADVGHICERSNVDAEIDAERVPIHAAVCKLFPADALSLALTGGEDYVLACAGPRDAIARAAERPGNGELAIIGRIVERRGQAPEVRVLDASGAELALTDAGYKHFAANGTTGA